MLTRRDNATTELFEAVGSRLRSSRGAAAVEFALVSIPLMVLVFGIIGFGMVFTQQQALSNAARDAARAGVVTYTPAANFTCNSLVTQAQSDSATIGVNPANVSVTVTRGSTTICSHLAPNAVLPCTGATETGVDSQISVVVAYTTNVELLFSNPSFDLIGKGTFRCEHS